MKQIFKIIASVPRNDIVFCWFASVYASIAVFVGGVFGKRTIVVVGGVDVAKEPELNYGIFLSPWKAPLIRYALRNAHRVLVVDESLRHEAVLRAGREGRNIECVPTGYDPSFWNAKGTKHPEVLSVAVVLDKSRVRLKGIDTIIGAAKKLPGTKFTLIGVRPQAVHHLGIPHNVRIIEPIPRSELVTYYQKAKVYCQPSRREGLPNTLCEAMLCECIPVATDVGGNRHAVDKNGFLVVPGNADALVNALKRALRTSPRSGKRARKRMAELFPRMKRERSLLRIISDLTA
ncbi:MAG: glycosyltransferase family 4 protein [Ignavibacteriales bacterium]|nr:glycosyltransferase family 4 protein [Ignavibacteriales bacterium]